MRVGIIGGGPGGLMTAYLLEQKSSERLDIKLFEASDRLGGKILTERFSRAPVSYEAGASELYGYSQIRPDPLHNLIKTFRLNTVDMFGETVVLNDQILSSRSDIRRHLGKKALRAIEDFHTQARRQLSPLDYYNSGWPYDNRHPLARKSFQSLIAKVPSKRARRYLTVAVHSDLATEPCRTSALFGMQNALIDHKDYVQLYSIAGGLERLTQALTENVSAELATNCRVLRVNKGRRQKYHVHYDCGGSTRLDKFDAVVVALPNCWLPTIEWAGRRLEEAMHAHHLYYDGAAHYLRVSLLFQKPFWRTTISGSYFQTHRFGGCCVYDEGAKLDSGPYGVLNFLLAGSEALLRNNFKDSQLIEQALDALPKELAFGRDLLLEGRVHRWVGAVSAPRVGHRIRGANIRHLPEPKEHPGLFVVGDYLFDTTLNGVLDSADIATDLVLRRARIEKQPFSLERPSIGRPGPNGSNLKKSYFKYYDGKKDYEASFEAYFDHKHIIKLIKAVWGARPPYRFLDSGSANGLSIRAFRKDDVDAYGIENNQYIHKRTPPKLRKRNLLADVRDIPFEDDYFDFVYDTSLCYVPECDLDAAIRELRRVTRRGIFFGSVTSDTRRSIIVEQDVSDGVQTWSSLPAWSERFLRNGFTLAIADEEMFGRVLKIERKVYGRKLWYASEQSLRYVFYSKNNVIDFRRPETAEDDAPPEFAPHALAAE